MSRSSELAAGALEALVADVAVDEVDDADDVLLCALLEALVDCW